MATPVISVGNVVLGEKDGFATFVITLDTPSTNAITVNYSESNGTAANTVDYAPVAAGSSQAWRPREADRAAARERAPRNLDGPPQPHQRLVGH
jgi:hypothetical protein